MALVKCPECGKDVSDKATVCPHCGCPANFFAIPDAKKQSQNENEKKANAASTQPNDVFAENTLKNHNEITETSDLVNYKSDEGQQESIDNGATIPKPKHKMSWGCILIVIVTIAIVGYWIIKMVELKTAINESRAYRESTVGLSNDDLSSSDISYAWVAAQIVVEENLKNPGSVEFPFYDEATITKFGNEFTIKGYCDAQNDFGAMKRVTFTVVIEKVSEEKFNIISVSVNE